MSDSEAPQEGHTREWVLTTSALRRLLDWLDEGASSDGQAYVEVRRRLRVYFERKNCQTPDDLADETLTRVARRLEEEGVTRGDSPARYCYIVARFVFLEHLRHSRKHQPIDENLLRDNARTAAEIDEVTATEKALTCLERCIATIDPLNRRIITGYYIGSERAKIDNRRALAASLGLSMNAVMVRACRVRARLEACVSRCISAN